MATASMHGSDIARLGVEAGDVITIASRRGQVTLRVRRDDGTPQGTVFVPFAYYEAAANMMTNPALDPFGKIPEFKYCAVAIHAGGQLPANAGFGVNA
jgi:formate dehydrogenase major subunit